MSKALARPHHIRVSGAEDEDAVGCPVWGALRGTLCLGRARTCVFSLSLRSRAPPGRQVSVPDVKFVRFLSTSSTPVNHEEDRLVYIGNLGTAVLGVKFFSYSTSVVSLIILPMIFAKSGIGVDSLPLKIAFFSIVGFFTFITPVTLHLLTKGYVVRLYHNKERDLYTAITYNAFLREKRTEFSPEDVEVPGVSKMFTTFYAKKKSMLINPMLFPNSNDYQHLMGYDKPFTFNLEDLNPPSKEK
ncbi:transmembrane protein 70, mitochondrial-like [Bufo bufo]|uniref:transmembrane protein 70, mitochondrial-like n=1 Tax=Bufo bufo TaxID=8384 RepID=UPI001ABED6C5|nr:transmembrane protein 70, mitochondrial-like [Bufo bufo]